MVKIKSLVKESHHRVKNNMQMINNLLTLQSEGTDNNEVILAFNEIKNRIHSIALIHEKLYTSSNLKEVNVKQYIEELTDFIEESIGNDISSPIKKITIHKELVVDSETISSLGLIINELITNSYKYAFKAKQENELDITITKSNNIYELTYSDSGIGLPDDFKLENSKSLGLELIKVFASQLEGSVYYTKSPRSTFRITFKKAKTIH